MLDAAANLSALKNAAGTVAGLAGSLDSGPLSGALPIVAPTISGGARVLSGIVGDAAAFSAISTALGNIDPSSVHSEGDLKGQLGSGFSVAPGLDNSISVTYTKDLSNATVGLSAATNLNDFFADGQPSHYLSKIDSLSGSANGTLAAGSHFTVTFGADAGGFFIQHGPIFSSPEFTANLSLSGTVHVGQLVFSVGVSGTGTLDLKDLSLTLSKDLRGGDLTNIGQNAAFGVGPASQAKVTGNLAAKVFGQDLLDWTPTITWAFGGNGAAQTAQVNVGSPSLNQGNEGAVEGQLLGSLANSLGLNQLGIPVNPLADVPGALQDVINFVSQLTGEGLDSSGLNPQDGLDSLTKGTNFTFASPSDLVSIANGDPGVNLVTYATDPINFLPDLSAHPTLPIANVSLLGIINLIFKVGASFDFTGTAQLGMGIDTSGLFLDANKTNVTFKAGVGADIGVDVNVLGVLDNVASARIGPEFTTTATIDLNNPNSGAVQNGKAYLSSLVSSRDQSNPLSGLGPWLGNALHLHVGFQGSINLTVDVNTGAAAVIQNLPPGVKEFAKTVSGLAQKALDFVSDAVTEVCDVVEDIPFIGSPIAHLVNCHDVPTVAEVALGDLAPVIDAAAEQLGGTVTHPNGIGSSEYAWSFPVTTTGLDFYGGSQLNQGSAAGANASAPTDYISYQVTGSKLVVTGKPGTDNIQVHDLGNGQIQLLRSGVDPGGGGHSDPPVVLSGITQMQVDLVGDGGDYFAMDKGLKIDTTVTGGAGNDTILTGAGNDSVLGMAGNDSIDGGDGNDTLNGGDGNDTITGGNGNDSIFGFAGDDVLSAGDGNTTVFGGDGNDTIYGGAGKDELRGEGGNDVIYAGSGDNTLYGGAGSDTLFGGAGNDVLYGGDSDSELHAGSGNNTLYGGPGNDALYGGAGHDLLDGGAGDDTIYGGTGSSTLSGGDGNDFLQAGTGDDTMIGGAGNDTFVIENPTSGVLPSSTVGGITIFGGAQNSTDPGQAGDSIVLLRGSGPAFTETYSAGTGANSGTVVTTDGTTTQTVTFTGIPSTFDTVFVKSLTVNATAGPDQISDSDGGATVSLTLNKVTVNGQSISFAHTPALAINALGGDDSIAVNLTTLATDLTSTKVDGGDGTDTFSAVYHSDFVGSLVVANCENIPSIQVVGNLTGSMTATSPGNVQDLTVGQSITASGQVLFDNLAAASVGGDVAGTVQVADTIGTMSVAESVAFGGLIQATSIEDLAIGGDVAGTVRATGTDTIGTMTVGGSVTTTGLISSAGSIGYLSVSHDIAGTVTAGTTIGTLLVGGSITTTGQVMSGGDLTTLGVTGNVAGLVNVGGNLSTATVGQDISGTLQAAGSMGTMTVGGSVTYPGLVSALGDLVLMTVGGDMAGQLVVGGTLGTLRVLGGTPGIILAGHVGTVGTYGGYGPLVLQIREAGIWRRVEAAVPAGPYPLPAPAPAPTPPVSPAGVTFEYFYESGTLASPQLTARVSNTAGTAPDQYDLSLVTWSDSARFNLARLDANGVAGIRNVAVEGDVLTGITAAAASFFGLPANTPGGVALPQDNLAGVAVRDYLPNGFVQAASIQALAFGAHSEENGLIETGAQTDAEDGEDILAPGTAIVPARNPETFRVPFADAFPVAFFFDSDPNSHHFDSHGVVFTDQVANDPRGAVTALVTVVMPVDARGRPQTATIQRIDLRGDGGAIQTQQPITTAITSTGPLGDLFLEAPGGIVADVTAPSIIGSIDSGSGPITGTIQTTGVRLDPISGQTGAIPPTFGRVVTVMTPGGPVATTTTVHAVGGGIEGRLISRGDFLSQVTAEGGISGLIAVQGNLGTRSGSVRLGGILSDGPVRGQLVVRGTVLGDVTLHGGLQGGRIAVEGNILGNMTIDGGIDATSALVTAGSIGDATAGTELRLDGDVKGILAAAGSISFDHPPSTTHAAFFGTNLGTSDPTSTNAIDAIFTPAFDVNPLDLGGLEHMLTELASLGVQDGELSVA
jgi:Ca2+-binding RTX toxin-like protein